MGKKNERSCGTGDIPYMILTIRTRQCRGSGLSGIRYIFGGSSDGVGCAAISLKLDEINGKLREQTNRCMEILAEIMEIIECLPEQSAERIVLGNRYIDGYSWSEVCRRSYINKTPAVKR